MSPPDTKTERSNPSTGPLIGVRVIELAHIMAGPICGLMLADLGANVIKVEKIDGGDDTRRFLPPDINGESAAFMMMNRNKRGIALDLKASEGRDACLKLIATADILIENYRHDTMDRLGLGYETLKEINPALVYCSVSGFGRTGPLAEQGGFDLVAQGMSGLMSITGEGPGRPPVKSAAPVSDITAGITAALGCLAAYTHRLKTGQGQCVDTSLFEAAITQTYWQSAITMATGNAPPPMGSAHPLNAPYESFETADRWINIGGANQRNWLRILDVIGAVSLNDDPRYATNADRMTHRQELTKALAPYFRAKPSAHWLDAFAAAGVPAGPVLDIAEMHVHPQTLARDMVPTVNHPVAGETQTIGCPLKFSETPSTVTNAAPTFGQHTIEILSEIGLSTDTIARLTANGTIAATRQSAFFNHKDAT